VFSVVLIAAAVVPLGVAIWQASVVAPRSWRASVEQSAPTYVVVAEFPCSNGWLFARAGLEAERKLLSPLGQTKTKGAL